MIQSSGMGKSRTADEASKQIFTLPFNLRHQDENGAYPFLDPPMFLARPFSFFLEKRITPLQITPFGHTSYPTLSVKAVSSNTKIFDRSISFL